MKKITSLCCIISLMICTNITYGQGVKFGFSFSYGMGSVKNGGSIQKYYDYQMAKDPRLLEYKITQKEGSVFGFSGIISYEFNTMFSLNTGLTFLKQSNELELHQKEIKNSNGAFRENHAVATISISSLNIPLVAKVRFGEKAFKPFLNGGLSLESRLSKTISSNETRTDWDDKDKKYDYKSYTFSDKPLEGFDALALNYIVGLGFDFELKGGQVLFLAGNYSSTIGQSELWSKNLNSNSANVGENNRIFDSSDQSTIESSDGIKMNDWKSSNLMFSIGILF